MSVLALVGGHKKYASVEPYFGTIFREINCAPRYAFLLTRSYRMVGIRIMAINVLLCIDLINITSKQRTIFNSALSEAHWANHIRLPTIWTAVLQKGVADEGVISATKTDVQNAAVKAKITDYDVLIYAGDSKPTASVHRRSFFQDYRSAMQRSTNATKSAS